MPLPASLTNKLELPVVGSPLFIVSGPELVIAQCKAGIVGSFPALNASYRMIRGPASRFGKLTMERDIPMYRVPYSVKAWPMSALIFQALNCGRFALMVDAT